MTGTPLEVERGLAVIKNQQQYRVTKAQVKRLEEALKGTGAAKTSLQPALHEAVIAGLEAQIGELQEEMEEYDALKTQDVLVAGSFEELPQILIKARIARGWTQEDLARKLKLKGQQIQRYESTDYRTVSLGRLLDIAAALNIELERCETRLAGTGSSTG
jgi:ribosome-binding protein aMBF1 (putative translation factor)